MIMLPFCSGRAVVFWLLALWVCCAHPVSLWAQEHETAVVSDLEPRPVSVQPSAAPTQVDKEAELVNLTEQRITETLHRAAIALKLQHYPLAERFFIEALNIQMSAERRQAILKQLAAMYEDRHMYSKLAAVYEKWLELYPRDREVPAMYLRLGRLYRDMGAYETAVSRFYSILNFALAWHTQDMEATKTMAREAQWEIAQTYFLAGNYTGAQTFLTRLERLSLGTQQQEDVDFKLAYCAYSNKTYTQALERLGSFIDRHPHSSRLPEAHFLMAATLKALNKSKEAVAQVKKLIALGLSEEGFSREQLQYWQQRTGNHVANEFYNQGEYAQALKVYQAMLPMRPDIQWQWPVIYQIGLCFERLGLYDKAHQAYTVIREAKEWPEPPEQWSEALRSVHDMASWRQEHMVWLLDIDQRMDRLFATAVQDEPLAPPAPQEVSP